MKTVRVLVKKKEGVLDIEGKAIASALNNLGMQNVVDVKKGFFVELKTNETEEAKINTLVHEACEKLLVNDVIEAYTFELLK